MESHGNNYKHGYYGTPTYKSWSEMKYRCNHNIKKYKNVSYCKRWESFENFLADMGERPPNKTLDRINFNGIYEPNNCKWSTSEEQNNNKSSNKYYLIKGEKLTISQIAKLFKISRSNLANKIYLYHWDIEKAINYLIERRDNHSSKENV